MSKKYNIIYADPPWEFSSKVRRRNGIQKGLPYNTMTTKDICNLPIDTITFNDCILFMWTTDAHMEDAIKVINTWGFKYKTIGFIWLKKEKSGKQTCYVGPWTLKGSEQCLLAIKGHMRKYLIKHNIRQLVEAIRTGHSRKPNEVRNRIVEMFGNKLPRIELFAREKYVGWDSWGDEIESDIYLDDSNNEFIYGGNNNIMKNYSPRVKNNNAIATIDEFI